MLLGKVESISSSYGLNHKVDWVLWICISKRRKTTIFPQNSWQFMDNKKRKKKRICGKLWLLTSWRDLKKKKGGWRDSELQVFFFCFFISSNFLCLFCSFCNCKYLRIVFIYWQSHFLMLPGNWRTWDDWRPWACWCFSFGMYYYFNMKNFLFGVKLNIIRSLIISMWWLSNQKQYCK